MNEFYIGVAGFLFLTVIAGLWRALRGPDPGDRIMAAQLFGTTAAAIMLLLAEALQSPSLRYLALVFASLAVVSLVALVRLTWPEEAMEDEHEPGS